MKANKKGISLIVLIITIVVIIILAAAIILNLSNTNIIDNANKAVKANDKAEVESAVTVKYGDLFVEGQSAPTAAAIATALENDDKLAVYHVNDERLADKKDAYFKLADDLSVEYVEAAQ